MYCLVSPQHAVPPSKIECPLPPLLTKNPPLLHPLLLPKKLHNLISHLLRPTNITNRPSPPLRALTPLPPIQRTYQIPLSHPPRPRPIRQFPMLNLLPTFITRRPRQKKRKRHVQRLRRRADEIHQPRQEQDGVRVGLGLGRFSPVQEMDFLRALGGVELD